MVFVMCIAKIDFGPMAKEEKKAKETGDLGVSQNTEEAEGGYRASDKGRVFDMLIPIIALIVFSILAMLYNGGFWGEDPAYHDIGAAFGNCVAAEALVMGAFGALVVALLLFLPRRLMSLKDFMAGVGKGIKSMVPADIILILAWTISGVCRDLLMTGEFVKQGVEAVSYTHLDVYKRQPCSRFRWKRRVKRFPGCGRR